MKNKLIFITLSLAFLFVTQTFAQRNSAAKIRIINVNSASPIISGSEIEISVEVEYRFESGEEGFISIGFNSEEAQSFKMEQTLNIKKGSDKVTLKALITPKEWKNVKFKLLAILTATPTKNSFTPSASDTKVIKLKK
jgi:hypothetical protein